MNHIVYRICESCYERRPWDLSLLTFTDHCYSVAEHRKSVKVLVTKDHGLLVKIRPLPELPLPQYFRKCYFVGSGFECCLGDCCPWPHSETEQRTWNKLVHCAESQFTRHKKLYQHRLSEEVSQIHVLNDWAKTQFHSQSSFRGGQ